LQLSLTGALMRGSTVLKKGAVAAAPGGAPPPASTPGSTLQGNYRGQLTATQQWGSSTLAFTADLNVANGRLTGQIVERRCGSFPLDVPVSPTGEISGEMSFLEDTQCGRLTAKVTGKVTADTLQIELRTVRTGFSGTLKAVR
jgi:hypothetical protein